MSKKSKPLAPKTKPVAVAAQLPLVSRQTVLFLGQFVTKQNGTYSYLGSSGQHTELLARNYVEVGSNGQCTLATINDVPHEVLYFNYRQEWYWFTPVNDWFKANYNQGGVSLKFYRAGGKPVDTNDGLPPDGMNREHLLGLSDTAYSSKGGESVVWAMKRPITAEENARWFPQAPKPSFLSQYEVHLQPRKAELEIGPVQRAQVKAKIEKVWLDQELFEEVRAVIIAHAQKTRSRWIDVPEYINELGDDFFHNDLSEDDVLVNLQVALDRDHPIAQVDELVQAVLDKTPEVDRPQTVAELKNQIAALEAELAVLNGKLQEAEAAELADKQAAEIEQAYAKMNIQ